MAGTPGEAEATAASESAGGLLLRCLSALDDPEERAVVELRYLAYVNPKLIAAETLRRVAGKVSRARLEAEFQAAQDALRELQEEEIAERETRRQGVYARQEAKLRGLELQGWSRARINELRTEPGVTIEGLEAQLAQPGTDHRRRPELEFQIECVRYRLALGRLLEARDKLARYRQAKHPWVRNQEEIARLLGISQAKVCKRLQSALAAMLKWRRENPPRGGMAPPM
jgi:outer membrane cobalamin receptor